MSTLQEVLSLLLLTLISASGVDAQEQPCTNWVRKGKKYEQSVVRDSAIYCYRNAVDCLSESSVELAPAYLSLADLYNGLSKFDSAKIYARLARKQGDLMGDTLIIGHAFLRESSIFHQEGDFETTTELLLRSCDLYTRIGADSFKLRNFINLATCFDLIGDTDQAEKYTRKAVEYARIYGKEKAEAISLMQMVEIYARHGQKDSIPLVLDRILHIGRQYQSPLIVGYAYANMAIYGEPEKGEKYFLKSLEVPGVRPFDRIRFRINYAKYLLDKGAFSKARREAQIALEQAESIGAAQLKVDILLLLMKTDAGQASYRQAYESSLAYQELKDSIFSENSKGKINELSMKFETALKEKENQALIAENATKDLKIQEYRNRSFRYTILAIAAILVACCFVYMWFQSNRLAQKDREILKRENELKEEALHRLAGEKEIELLKAKMSGEERERSRIARELHDGLGALLASIRISLTGRNQVNIGETCELVDRASEELHEIAHNLSPANLNRFGLFAAIEDICNDMSTSNTSIHFQTVEVRETDLDQIKSPLFRMIQELVSNCMKHARATEVLIQLSQKDQTLHVVVEDDGVGMESWPPRAGNRHFGIGNIEYRLSQLAGNLYIDSKLGQGTSVNLVIPLAG